VSESPEIRALQAEMEAFAEQGRACAARIRELRGAEDPARGVFFAQEIFAATQEKLRLEVEAEFKRKKINRIRLGISDENLLRDQGGLPF
jgi:hypothetical protein